MDSENRNLYWHEHAVSIQDRWETNGHKSCVIWFTGLSASGKSTIANALCKQLHNLGIKGYVLDGDNIRHGLNKDLGFSPENRKENIRRIGEVAKLFVDAGLIVMTAFISPFREDRDNARNLLKGGEYIEVYVKCPLVECEKRDPKGIYKKARIGKVHEFTGISSPYEEPEKPELVLETDKISLDQCIDNLLEYLSKHNYIQR